ncbi:hypothetical protein OG223_20600 [Streptomyces sp. NBC_01478]|uniref:hypothetical protein n=1 Tax=Streptomyces sp. NBC_01478 TaxID=2903882 RepID=UPI002E36D0AF|nr:hypothetical protein [Streptomyces sp. NBC_01478]
MGSNWSLNVSPRLLTVNQPGSYPAQRIADHRSYIRHRNPAGHQDVVIREERIEVEAPINVCGPLCERQVRVRLTYAGADRLGENPTRLVTTARTATEVARQPPQRVTVVLFIYDGDQTDVSKSTLVAGLRGVGDGEVFERKLRADDHVLNLVVAALIESPLRGEATDCGTVRS